MVLLLKHGGPSIKIRATSEEYKPLYLLKEAFLTFGLLKPNSGLFSRDEGSSGGIRPWWFSFLLRWRIMLLQRLKSVWSVKASAHKHNTLDTISMLSFCRAALSLFFYLSPANPGFDEDLKIPQIWASALKKQSFVFPHRPSFLWLFYPSEWWKKARLRLGLTNCWHNVSGRRRNLNVITFVWRWCTGRPFLPFWSVIGAVISAHRPFTPHRHRSVITLLTKGK